MSETAEAESRAYDAGIESARQGVQEVLIDPAAEYPPEPGTPLDAMRPVCRIQWAHEPADRDTGSDGWASWVLAADQTGTTLEALTSQSVVFSIAEARTALADLRDTLQQYATATTLAVPAWWMPDTGKEPLMADQLEHRDIGGPAREALQRLQAGPYRPEGPLLGLATTAELVEELQARLELRGYAPEPCLQDLAARCRVDERFNAATAEEPARPRCAGPQPVYDGQPRIPDFVNPPPR